MPNRIKSVTQTEETTVLRVLVTPFGDATNLDLHGEFFDAGTDFGDGQVYPVKTAFYEHGFNTQSNPHMKADRQIIGTAKFVEQDEWGRWYDFEIKRALEYHDYVMKLVDLGLMGASSGCFPGMKRLDGNVEGRIKMWYEAEPSLTPTPAHPFTIGQVKYGAEQIDEINALVKTFNLGHLFKELSVVSDTDDTATSDADVEGTDTAEPDTPDLDIDLAVKQILDGTSDTEPVPPVDLDGSDDPAPADLDAVAKAVSDRVMAQIAPVIEAQMKAGWNVFIELWGYGEEEPPQEAIAQLMGMSKQYKTDQDRTHKALTAMARAITKFSPKEVMDEISKMSELEKKALNNLPQTRTVKSAIPDDAPGG